jgi:hypothetical protein
MSIVSHCEERADIAVGGALSMAITAGLSWLGERAQAARRRRRDTHLLSELDDNLLRDLGVLQARIEQRRR